MLVCAKISQTIETVWNEYIHHSVKQAQKRCKKWPWPLSWLCKVVTTLIEWLETIVHTLIQAYVALVCHVVQAFIAIIKAWVNLIVDLWLRFIGLIDFIAGLVGILPIKNLRLHVVILRRSDLSLTAPENQVDLAIQRTKKIFRDRAHVKIVPTVHVMDDSSPGYALQIKSGLGCVFDQASDAGAYFRLLIETKLTGLLPAFWLRIASPIVAFVVEGVGDDIAVGCSSGPLGEFVCVEGSVMNDHLSTLAHELGHACGLILHDPSDNTNLMFSDGTNRGTNLSPFQRGIVRSSTHVTYI